MTQVVVDSHDIILGSSERDSGEDLTSALANTRIVSNEETYTVEKTEKSTVKEIQTLYCNSVSETGSSETLRSIPENSTLFSIEDDKKDELCLSDIEIGTFTQSHLEHYPSTGTVSTPEFTPIEPVIYAPEDDTNKEIYFADVQTRYVVKVQLRNSKGERQTVYRESEKEEDTDEFIKNLGSHTTLQLRNGKISIKNVKPDTSDTGELGNLKRLRNALLEIDPRTVAIFGVYVIALLANIYYYGLNSTVLILTYVAFPLYLFTMVLSYHLSSHVKNTTNPIDEDISEPVSFELPYNLELITESSDPIAKVHIDTEYTEEGLTARHEPSGFECSYKTTEDGIFKNTNVVDFYTAIGLNKSEIQEFIAFVSPNEYTDVTRLELSKSDTELYMYPEDPQSV